MKIKRRKFLSSLGMVGLGSYMPGMVNASVPNLHDKTGIKISDVKTFRVDRGIFVKLETDAGYAGWGESSPNSTEIIESFIHNLLKKEVIGRDPFDVEPIWDELFWKSHDLGPAGALPYAIAGIDLALWDLKGKILKQPVYNLLGGSFRKEMKVYGGFGVLGGKVPLEQAIKRAVNLAEKGFTIVKLRMQIRENNLNPIPDPTLKYYTAIRKELPDSVELFVDPNEGYTASRAIQIGKELQQLGMKFYESPCPLENHKDTAAVVEAMDIPVLAGEKCYTRWQFRDLILQANPDVIQPDLIKSGGITEVKKVAALGQTFFKTLAPHNTKPTLGTAAAMHLLASISNAGPFIEFIETELYGEVMSVFDTLVEFKNGKLIVPQANGLGIEINEKKLKTIAR
ncbi:mandelate racemase/muconate lactonizing enzyme family protein [Flexithrix dorotheae]|uniref:mandelate racemase/muconate lactonizing enzyme family protein n=1 Tax=Flexithrix dorotheae TaxID=70993 RepID=UPI000373E338|nr:mandelate racemase/muconate lactonizing enzyme family protein [Flexithrix dorotheae]